MSCIVISCSGIHMVNNLCMITVYNIHYIAVLQSLKQLLDSRLRSAGAVSGRYVQKNHELLHHHLLYHVGR